MNRREFLKRTGAGTALALAPSLRAGQSLADSAASSQASGRPNVLFLICDDLNAAVDPIGGHPQVQAPNLRRLMAKGVTFLNGQSNCPLCAPSRASLVSGFYPHTTGDFGYKQGERPWRRNPVMKDCVSLFDQFKANGYALFGSGKLMHEGYEDYRAFTRPDGSIEYLRGLNHGPYPWDGREQTRAIGVPHPDLPPGFAVDPEGKTKWDSNLGPIENLSSRFGGKGGWTLNGKPWRCVSEEDRDRLPDERTAAYGAHVLGEAHAQPFFLGLGFYRPHAPLLAPRKYFDRFPLDRLTAMPRLANDLDDCARILGRDHNFGTQPVGFAKYAEIMKGGGEAMLLRWTQAYLASIAFVDDQIGKVLDALESGPHAGNTIVVFTADHGYHMGQKDQVFKNSPWEEATRIPMIMAGPGIAKGRLCRRPVSNVDWYPTLNDYCHFPADPNRVGNGRKLDGYSMRPFLEDPEGGRWAGPSVAVSVVAAREPLEPNQPGEPRRQFYSVRSERFRYIRCPNGEEELYDHDVDPFEWTNVVADPRYAADRDGMHQAWSQVTGIS